MRNRLLSTLSSADRALIEPRLTAVDLPVKRELHPPGAPLESVYFMESGLASVITTAGKERIEVGVVGREGMTGAAAVLGGSELTHESIMQLSGSGWRMSVADLRRSMAESAGVTRTLLRFVNAFLMQVSQTALANGRNTVEQRLARWLLMAHDRIDGNEVALTHEFLAVMLGVRRPGVTVALHVLEGEHGIRSRRNSITVLDRDKLKAIAGPTYGTTEAYYERLFGSTAVAA